MRFHIRPIEYFHTQVPDVPGEAHKLLATLAEGGINLLAFTAVPCGPMRTQLTLFPEEPAQIAREAARSGIRLDGPHRALLVRGDDRLGAFADIHRRLYHAGVNVYASSGIVDAAGSYGYVLYVRPEEFTRAVEALRLDA
ncbi:MAG: hypothetical protein PVF68_01515 [Acidobacteriota bacterium]|jgi:hypothetical protein